MTWKTRAAALAAAVLAACASAPAQTAPPPAASVKVPDLPREFRGVWVATVANIDWPSKPGLSTEKQQEELLAILDRVRDLNMNAVVLQIRPAADALYKSDLEPWSQYLTGKQGQAPEPFYDPLEFAVEEAHKRGIELHVWFNPYRARLLKSEKTETGTVLTAGHTDPNHISVTHPEVVKTYGSHQWMDPGEKLVQDHSLNVILDVVKRYDIDGVHMDDYFYPYPITDPKTKQEVDFPDEVSWTRYKEGGGRLSRSDWRRRNVDSFIERLYKRVKAEKPHVLVGLSPFGIWKPGFPEQIKGFDQYEKLYADAKLWLNRGWVDYFTPQLYWRIQDLSQSYPVLLQWWVDQNTRNRHIWPGLFTTKPVFGPDEIINQIVITRFVKGATGHVHFSMKGFMSKKAESFNDRLTTTTGVYAAPAVVPETTWLAGEAPARLRGLKAELITTETVQHLDEEPFYVPAAEDATTETLAEAAGQTTATAEQTEETTETAAAAEETTETVTEEQPTTPTQAVAEETTAAVVSQDKPAAAEVPAKASPGPKKMIQLSWNAPRQRETVTVYAVYVGRPVGGSIAWKFHVVPPSETRFLLEADEKGSKPVYFAVSAVGRLGKAGRFAVTRFDPPAE